MAEARRSANSESTVEGARILIVEARFYNDIADALLAGAVHALQAAGAQHDRVTVPGALEIPAAIAIAIDAAKDAERPYDGAVALGWRSRIPSGSRATTSPTWRPPPGATAALSSDIRAASPF